LSSPCRSRWLIYRGKLSLPQRCWGRSPNRVYAGSFTASLRSPIRPKFSRFAQELRINPELNKISLEQSLNTSEINRISMIVDLMIYIWFYVKLFLGLLIVSSPLWFPFFIIQVPLKKKPTKIKIISFIIALILSLLASYLLLSTIKNSFSS
jgi:RsiW-degrading membrane proteinase PrsW (M82 family)